MSVSPRNPSENRLLEPSRYASDGGELIGRHPDEVTVDEWLENLSHFDTGLAAVRRNCLECVFDSPSEVRKCVCTNCPFWAFRLGRVPVAFRKAKVISTGFGVQGPSSTDPMNAEMAVTCSANEVEANTSESTEVLPAIP